MRRLPVYAALFFFCCAAGGSQTAFADDKGPVEVVIQSTLDTGKGVARPAFLPHQKHQWLECDGCHHGKGKDGKKIDFIVGQKIEKCETCHNSKAGMPERVATLNRAGHLLCMECHLQNDKELAKCGVCHIKKLKQ